MGAIKASVESLVYETVSFPRLFGHSADRSLKNVTLPPGRGLAC
jgi:hypothetical protein